jgi:hypothetical protein
MDPISKAFIAQMEQFAQQGNIPVVRFRKGQTIATENWQTFLKRYHDCCDEKGLVAAEITKF